MIKWHIDNEFTRYIKNAKRFKEIQSEEDHSRLYSEVRNVVLQELGEKLIEKSKEAKIENKVNSLLLWVLEITDDKPTESQTIKSQGSYADFDIDFSKDKRILVKEYLKQKYGEDRVSEVVTFGTLAAKAAVRSAQRALGYSIDTGHKIAKLVPDVPGIKLQEAIDNSKQLKEMIESDANAAKIIDIALKLEGLPQNLGVHACAFIIGDRKLTDYMPQMIATKKDGNEVITQFEYKDVEAIG